MRDSAIRLPSAEPCAFCAYLDGTRPFTFVTRNATTAVMVTQEQRGKPHLLVISTAHRETILDLTDAECSALMIEIKHAASAIDAAYHRPGISVWQNNGEPASQSIRHVHFHVAGTLDSGGTEWGPVDELSLVETERIAERIKRHWPGGIAEG
ncbi:HIT family protein [Propionibacterium freudenreichii]|uniref:HIT family protein n=1 Tax=Propionibacterium freudenreichii TaxID=1744 RepID=UPI0021A44FB6|nr:HIT family protein [Propionibacterium freudenreichii]MCT2977620.1 HIT family protein [Propionibacterium freudenreichii]MCT2985389.1 HIT family protein [Propionibacterium freudenreichii]MCT2986982.1 HIT family protein [Propionibacterium freudenreichii]